MEPLKRQKARVFAGIKYCLLVALMMSFNAQATPATLISDAELKASPDFGGDKVSDLNKGDSVAIKQRERGWYQVETQDNRVGWIVMLRLKLNNLEVPKSDGNKSRLVSLRQGHSNITATTGVRGIGESDIKNAKADFDSLQKAKAFAVTQQQAREFAGDVKLRSVEIQYEVESDED